MKVLFPGIELGSTDAKKLRRRALPSWDKLLTFIEICCHPLVVTAHECVILSLRLLATIGKLARLTVTHLVKTRSMDCEETDKSPRVSVRVIESQ